MKKEIEVRSSASACNEKNPTQTRSSSQKYKRFKLIRRLKHHSRNVKKSSCPLPAPSVQHIQDMSQPNVERRCDIPSNLELDHYLDDIFFHLNNVDKSFHNNTKHRLNISSSTSVTLDMRKVLVRWLIKVAARFRCKSETLHMCIQIIDQILIFSGASIEKGNFQLLGIASLFISCKYNQIYSMQAQKYIHVCEGIFSLSQLFEMESFILTTLCFNLQIPTIHQFTGFLINTFKIEKQYSHIIKALGDMTIFDFSAFNGMKKSDMAIAIVYFVAKMYKLEELKNNISYLKGSINSQDFKRCFLVALGFFKKNQSSFQ